MAIALPPSLDKDRDAFTLAARLAAALDTAGVPYAIGGAIAYGIWAIPEAPTMSTRLDGPLGSATYLSAEATAVFKRPSSVPRTSWIWRSSWRCRAATSTSPTSVVGSSR